jgi:hypothetical protein
MQRDPLEGRTYVRQHGTEDLGPSGAITAEGTGTTKEPLAEVGGSGAGGLPHRSRSARGDRGFGFARVGRERRSRSVACAWRSSGRAACGRAASASGRASVQGAGAPWVTERPARPGPATVGPAGPARRPRRGLALSPTGDGGGSWCRWARPRSRSDARAGAELRIDRASRRHVSSAQTRTRGFRRRSAGSRPSERWSRERRAGRRGRRPPRRSSVPRPAGAWIRPGCSVRSVLVVGGETCRSTGRRVPRAPASVPSPRSDPCVAHRNGSHRARSPTPTRRTPLPTGRTRAEDGVAEQSTTRSPAAGVLGRSTWNEGAGACCPTFHVERGKRGAGQATPPSRGDGGPRWERGSDGLRASRTFHVEPLGAV